MTPAGNTPTKKVTRTASTPNSSQSFRVGEVMGSPAVVATGRTRWASAGNYPDQEESCHVTLTNVRATVNFLARPTDSKVCDA